MKRLLAVLCLSVPLAFGVQSANAEKLKPLELNIQQLDQVNGGLALANATAVAGANGAFFSFTNTTTTAISVSVLVPGLNPSGSFSNSGSLSFAN